jgi:hypothetical protein
MKQGKAVANLEGKALQVPCFFGLRVGSWGWALFVRKVA